MDNLSPVGTVQPLRGHVSLLKTMQETRSGKDIADAYVAEINIKSASKVLKLLDSKFPKDPNTSFTHLRRFVKPEFLPEHLRKPDAAAAAGAGAGAPVPKGPQTIYVLIPPPLPDVSALQELLAPHAPLLPIATPAADTPEGPPQPQPPAIAPITIQSTPIPLSPPTTEEESSNWTRNLWPTIFNPAAQSITHSPRGPLLTGAQTSVERGAGAYLALAREVAIEAKRMGRGRGVGAVVVDPVLAQAEAEGEGKGNGVPGVVVVAADARYWERSRGAEAAEKGGGVDYNPDHEGQPDHHALMRAISLVAHKRLTASTSPTVTPSISISPTPTPADAEATASAPASSTPLTSPPPSKKPKPSPSQPSPSMQHAESTPSTPHPSLTPLESHYLSLPNIQTRTQGGYLCTSLDLYITHEPCVCCAMGMLLSRFRAVVYLKPAEGKEEEARLDAALDPYVGYGLHWRRELNWRAVGFRFVEEKVEGREEGLERGVFHA
ncbi:hypothetical protein AJ79_03486 [Helicocarpus griseus UAMH5409]|uniref:CMP/dCMP-type deaminase domain-containing protein n=1 Tax=Helicocarpus griseus UAMH5409 TaxID=1447875 RepID=A0A2B7XX49_9EURO|nr:hypothetical protein AJ79_03486 [Helicocarpus griseus UAMH5409]